MKRLIIGCGYLGRRVARSWIDRGDTVWALTRSQQTADEWQHQGIHPLVGDVVDADSLTELPAVDTVLFAVGFDRTASFTKRTVYVDGLRNVLQALPDNCGRLIYVSSTSVYGQSQGELVDEQSVCQPTSEGGRICHEAEQLARDLFRGQTGVCVLRLSGIYGPGRLAARMEGLRQQQPVSTHPEGWLNLIHVEDAQTAVTRVADHAEPPTTLLVSDDRPLHRGAYYQQLVTAIGAPPATFAPSAPHDLGKRCSNRRLQQILQDGLTYPTFADGLPSAIAALPKR